MSDPLPDRNIPVVVVTVFCLVFSILATGIRLHSKRLATAKFAIDDYIAITALTTLIVQTAFALAACHLGLGRSPDHQYYPNDKIEWHVRNTVVLFVPAMTLSRWSLIAFVESLTHTYGHRTFGKVMTILTITWGIAGTAVTSSLCGSDLMSTVNYTCSIDGEVTCTGSCLEGYLFNALIAFYTLGTFGDLILIMWPRKIVRRLSMSRKDLTVPMLSFLSRLGVVATTVAQIVVMNSVLKTKQWAYDAWSPILYTQMVQALSLITACLPCFVPPLSKLVTESNMGVGVVLQHANETADDRGGAAVSVSGQDVVGAENGHFLNTLVDVKEVRSHQDTASPRREATAIAATTTTVVTSK